MSFNNADVDMSKMNMNGKNSPYNASDLIQRYFTIFLTSIFLKD
ncbi:hypothetical protein BD31_I1896 [Candidatus Nitrosopumilus salaria BD31]|uniref:Uncharacterized protein n=1 Tax=Candidatus Nitrosopumilus salarius BD31 TaxID=859350 RepID=I3D267_9ARCH|nr:hypothetical protein BD31_I1896 [Candidatus Nitrosopumilus salaria BD31]